MEYVDNDISASHGPRPGYRQMLADIEAGAIHAVVSYHLDRLHRQPRELEDFIDLADKHHIALATATGDVDLGTDNGRLIARITGAVAKAEVERKGARQKAANKQRAESGRPWVTRPFGYTRHVMKDDRGKIVKAWYEIDDVEANAIRAASQALLNGTSLYSIAQEWNATGLRTSKGFLWEGSKVRHMLLRPSNVGLAVYRGEILTNTVKTEDGTTATAEVRIVEDAVLDREEWEAVCRLLADPKRFSGKSPGRKHLLSGIAWCGVCGRRIGTTVRKTKSRGNRPVYQCKNSGCMKIVRDLALTDEVVIGAVTERLAQPDAAVALGKSTIDTAEVKKQITSLRAQIKAAETEYDEGLIDGRRLKGRIERVTDKLTPLEDQLLGAHMSADIKKLAGSPDAAEIFGDLPLDRQRGVIDTLVAVTIRPQAKPGGRFETEAIGVDWK